MAEIWNPNETEHYLQEEGRSTDRKHEGHDVSYSLLPGYCEIVKETNPESIVICAWTPPDHPERPLSFSSIFIALKGPMEGLLAECRSLIGVDDAHLKGNYGGILLSAIALDGNNEIFPFAWAIVPGEDGESWAFFVWHLKNALKDSGRGDSWCIISDRQKGIDMALTEHWPKVGRRYCRKHLSKNWKRVFGGPLLFSLFWKACGATSKFTFKKAMEALDKVNPNTRIWLSKLGEQSRWTKWQFNPDIKSDVNKTNFVESFNATLGIDRCRPVLTLLEGIRRVTMVRLASRRQICEGWENTDICPNIVKRVQTLCQDSRTCKAYFSGQGEFEVHDGRSVLPVSLINRTYACNLWQIGGIPCKHGMRAILHAKEDPHKYWPEPETMLPEIAPPVMKRGAGRPCRNRRRKEDEQQKGKRSKTIRCGNRKEFGHNSLACKGGATAKQKKQQDKRATTSSQPMQPVQPRRSARLTMSQPV
ncbi:uncharacterized protein LOC104893355 [Beta vulgaris subsp. vulgaris]|uniref:uncharacterized protein LOC104893355 n=1 Tax=Beta vulgaris subsp. vulgaris TaxID=3555 RepID=UPI00053FDFEC|nr:uncharacterized protein LOC104893355 [Beta vulgaris subsp. vulgaris]